MADRGEEDDPVLHALLGVHEDGFLRSRPPNAHGVNVSAAS